MNLSDVVSTFAIPAVAVLVAVAAILRARDLLPGGRRDRQGLALALGGLAVGTTALVSPVYDALARLTGVDNVGEPIARSALMACAVGILGMVAHLAAGAVGDDAPNGGTTLVRRRRFWLAVAIAVLWTCFAFGPGGGQVRSYIVQFGDVLAVQLYLLVFLAFVGGAFLDLLRLGLRMRATLTGPLATSGWLITLGAACGCLYVLVRVTALGAAYLEAPWLLTALASPGALLAAAASILLVTGTLWLAVRSRMTAASGDMTAHAVSVRLYPLWRDLVRLRPAVAMEPDPGPVRAVLGVRHGRWRLYRRVIELRDAVRILRGRSVTVAPLPVSAMTSPRDTDDAADRAATALAEVVVAESSGSPAPEKVVPVPPAAATVEQEVAWWSRVASRYRLRRRQAQRRIDDEQTEMSA